MQTNNLLTLYQEGRLTEIDLHFAGFMSTLAGDDDPDLMMILIFPWRQRLLAVPVAEGMSAWIFRPWQEKTF
jgi:hypothetical protein